MQRVKDKDFDRKVAPRNQKAERFVPVFAPCAKIQQ